VRAVEVCDCEFVCRFSGVSLRPVRPERDCRLSFLDGTVALYSATVPIKKGPSVICPLLSAYKVCDAWSSTLCVLSHLHVCLELCTRVCVSVGCSTLVSQLSHVQVCVSWWAVCFVSGW